MKMPENENVELKKSKIHNYGVFAKKYIPKGTKIIQYMGEKITKEQSDQIADRDLENNSKDPDHGAVYIFELNDKYDIDGNVSYNIAKYINHACKTNCEAEIIHDEIWIVAEKDINEGEELHYNYGYDIDSYEDHPCKCGSEKCIGYILAEEHWPKLKKKK